MRLFGNLYARALRWASDRRAVYYLCALSFVEAFIFPVMPEVMLAPMMLARRAKAFFYANVSLLCSLAGSLVGYGLGHFAYAAVKPLFSAHMQAVVTTWVATLQLDMNEHWLTMLGALTLAALQPVIPMKFVTWAAGIVGVPIVPFLACIAVGRGKRVWLLALLIRLFGERAERMLERNIEWVGWGALVAIAGLIAWIGLR